MYAMGGMTFPIMGYFVSEGYRHTSNLKKYMLRLFVVGLIATPFHFMALSYPLGGGNPMYYPLLNIMFAILFSLVVLVLYDKIKIRALFWLLYAFVILPLSFMFLEWYFIGVTTVLLFHIIRNEKARRIVPPVFAGIAWLFLGLLARIGTANLPEGFYSNALVFDPEFTRLMPAFTIGCLFAVPFLMDYNGKRGRNDKWLFYAFYPLHLLVLAAIAFLFGVLGNTP